MLDVNEIAWALTTYGQAYGENYDVKVTEKRGITAYGNGQAIQFSNIRAAAVFFARNNKQARWFRD